MRGSECGHKIALSNRILATLRVMPYTEMQSYFRTKDGVISGNMLDCATTVNRRYPIASHVQIDFCKGCEYIAVHP